MKKQKCLNLEPKMRYLSICDQKCRIWVLFDNNFLKELFPCLKSAPLNFSNWKYCEVMKMPKFGTKNAWYGYFCSRIPKKLLSYLKSAPSNLSFAKCHKKAIMHKFATKNVWLLSIFGLQFGNNIVILEITTLEFV